MWTPNMPQPVATMLAHRAPLLALGVDLGGHMLASSGLDGQVKIWDIRTYKELHSYFTVRPAQSIDVSHQGMLALGFGPHVQVWKDAFKTKQNAPFMVKQLPGQIVKNVAFCPYEDVLGVGHSGGFSSLVIPGAGEANFDSFAANPFATRAQTREATVHSLLDKLQPDMITLDQNMFGLMDRKSKAAFDGTRAVVRQQKQVEATEKSMSINKARGRSKSSKKVNRKRANIIDQARMERADNAAKVQKEIVQRKDAAQREADGKPKSALQRFG
jgi:U3 small nucleolar RNA-associated protein 7